MIELSDCGKEIMVRDPNYGYSYKVEVSMIITGPKGRLVLFSNSIDKKGCIRRQKLQSRAIKAFMSILTMSRDGQS